MSTALNVPEPPARPGIRLRPAPAVDPPYDDERPGPLSPALWLVPPPNQRLPFEEPDPLDPAHDPAPEPHATARPALPPPRPFATNLVRAVVEILAGLRPLPQIRRLTSEEVYLQLQRRLATLQAGRLRGGPLPRPPRVRSVHVAEPTDGVAEVVAVICRGERHQAMAFRLEGVDGRWRCTVLHLL